MKRASTLPLKSGLIMNEAFPYALVTGQDSYLEVLDYPESKNILRLGLELTSSAWAFNFSSIITSNPNI